MVGVELWDWFTGVDCRWVGRGAVVVDVLVAFAGMVIVGMGVGIVAFVEGFCGGVSIAMSIDTWGVWWFRIRW